MAQLQDDEAPLFKGATRLPTFAGVPRTAMLLTFMLCGALFMMIHFWAIALFAFLWFIEFCITKHDDRMFRIIGLAIKTKIRNVIESPLKALWGGSTYATKRYIKRDQSNADHD
jgi:type IV secretion system protein VirB3